MFQDIPKVNNGASSGGGNRISIVPDTTQELGSITTMTGTFTAPEDCVMTGTMKGASGTAWMLLDGKSFISVPNSALEDVFGISSGVGIFIPKGSVLTVRNLPGQNVIYNFHFYKMKFD